MPEVWQMTCEQFVGMWAVDDSQLNDVDAAAADIVEEHTAGWIRSTLKKLPEIPGYYIAEIWGRHDDVALVFWDARNEEWEVVGGYVESTLRLDPFQRGKRLSPELVLAKAEKLNGIMDPISYTPAGKAAHVAAHRLAVYRAVKSGHRVPAHVLLSYPEMATQKRPAKASASAG